MTLDNLIKKAQGYNPQLKTENYALQNGELCEILVSKREKDPSRDWLAFVRTPTAQHRISKWLRKTAKPD